MGHTPAQKRELRAARKAAGLCYFCPNQAAAPGRVRCSSCAVKEAGKREAAKAAGRCAFCPGPRAPGKSRCESCLETARDGAAVKRAECAESGICVQCGAPSKPGSTQCVLHAAAAVAAARASTLRLRARSKDQVGADRDRLHPDGLKACRYQPAHQGPLPLAEFFVSASRPDGLSERCRACTGRSYRRRALAHWRASGIALECTYCQGPFEHVDHIIPTSRGGTDDLSNLTPACTSCNTSKGDRLPEEWLALRGGV